MIAYCDFIADRIRRALVASMNNAATEPVRLADVGRVNWDLGPAGEFQSTAKTLMVVDGNGKRYCVTVEEVR